MLKNMSEKQKTYALFGLAIGDGHYTSPSIRIGHTEPQKEYVEWLEKLCLDAGIDCTTRYNMFVNIYGKRRIYHRIRIRVPQRRHLDKLNRFYNKEGKKFLSKYVLRRINELGMLFWWLDDGSLHVGNDGVRTRRFGYLSTEGFDKDSIDRLVKMLQDRFNIKVGIHRNGKYYKVYFNATAMRAFIDIVRKYLPEIPKSMRYKFDLKYNIWPSGGDKRRVEYPDYTYEVLFRQPATPVD